METRDHRIVGAATALGAAHLHPAGPVLLLAATAAAVIFSGGKTSPDVDNQGAWKTTDHYVPDEVLGHGGPLQHRGLMHWPGLPIGAYSLGYLPVQHLPALAAALLAGAWLGWCSHLAADLLVGAEGYGHGRGIPLAPWWAHIGLGIHNESAAATVLSGLAAVAAVWFALTLAVPAPAVLHAVEALAHWSTA